MVSVLCFSVSAPEIYCKVQPERMNVDKDILLVILMILVVDAQRWPLSGSCKPCKCSLKDNSQEIVKHINCVNLNLLQIPSFLPADADSLDFSNNKLQSTGVNGVRKFHFLQHLSLANNNITALDDSPFSKSSLLTSVDFAGNKIKKLKKDAFRGLVNLRKLHGLQVDTTEAQVFEYLPGLSELHLEFGSAEIPTGIFDGLTVNSLKLTLVKAHKIPKDLFSFNRNTLNILHIVGPLLRSMHDDLLQGLTFLKSIYFEIPNAMPLPERIFNKFQLSNLQTIQLVSVQSLPSNIFRDMNNLRTLRINKADELPGRLFNSLFGLQVLDLSLSFLNQIPDNWFARLGSLISLNISETRLSKIDPDSLMGLTRLKLLDISGNSLRSIPKGVFTPCQNSLVRLDLSENILKSIETDALGGLASLTTLDLSDNKMSTLQSDTFSDLIRLSNLNMHENMLSSLPNNIFSHQQRLSKLNLASNLLRDFPRALLEVSDSLINCDISNNQIRNIDRCLEDRFPFLEFLSLESNPLHCDCNILKLKETHPNMHLEVVCSSPDMFKSQHVDKIRMPNECLGTKCVEQSGRIVFVDWISPTKVLPGGPESMLYASLLASGDMASQMIQQDGQGNYAHGGRLDLSTMLNRIEFQAIVGGVGGFIFMCVIAIVVYVKKRNKTRYSVPHLQSKNGVI